MFIQIFFIQYKMPSVFATAAGRKNSDFTYFTIYFSEWFLKNEYIFKPESIFKQISYYSLWYQVLVSLFQKIVKKNFVFYNEEKNHFRINFR